MITFSSLSQEIRNWIASDTVTYLIMDVNKRLDLKNEQQRTIAILINRLVTKDLEPQNFIPELAKSLNIGFASAKVIAQEITEKILKNIERPLRALGIDISKIQLGAEVGAPMIPAMRPAPPALPTPILPPPASPALPKPTPPAPPKPTAPKPPTTGEQPFIIYKERPELRETPAPAPTPAPITVPKKPEPPRPPEVKIPIKTALTPPPVAPAPPQPKKPGEVRMVHYSNFRTPLS